MADQVFIPFNPVIPFHGDVRSFVMLGPFQGPMEFDGWREDNDIRYDPGTIDQATGRMRTFTYHQDKVLKDGRDIGFSSGRAVSQTYHRMISLGFIERSAAAIGTEVVVVWGEPGSRQKQIRATVTRFPYLQVERNDKVDVETIPRVQAAREE